LKTRRLALVALAFLSGCEYNVVRTFSCPFPDWSHLDHEGHPDPCHIIKPPQVPQPCKGECVPIGTVGFRREPLLLWFGNPLNPQPCPDHAKSEFWVGYTGLIAEPECPTCTCGTSQCEMPLGLAATTDQMCQGPDFTPLDAPPDWDGSCISPATLPAGSFGALAIAPPTAGACVPIAVPTPPKATGEYSWTTLARACDGLVDGVCRSSDEMCSPTAKPPPPGFRQCIWYEDDIDEADLPTCPMAYPEQFVFYDDVDDQRDCTKCTCGPPLGTQCTAAVSAYQDTACGASMFPLFKDLAIGLGDGPQCVATMGGAALGAISASWAVNEPGACVPSGGDPYGEARPNKPRVFCCQPPPAE
jgi:hypothetical protein